MKVLGRIVLYGIFGIPVYFYLAQQDALDWIPFLIFFGLLTGAIAWKKGLGFESWFVSGMILPIIALPVVLFKSPSPQINIEQQD